MNAVIAEITHIAEQYIKAFGLDTRFWRVFRHSDNPAGHRFDRLVIIRPHWRVTFEQYAAFEERCENWFTRVSHDGQYAIL